MTPFLRKLLGLNWLLLLLMLALAIFGVVAIYSATYMREDPTAADFWRKQANWVAVGFFAWWLPRYTAERRVQNERDASAVLKSLAMAEADFRANDRDGNGVNDFWTADVAGLYRYGLIDRSIAEADARPLAPLTPEPIPKSGYYFVAMVTDESEDPPERLRQEADKASGKVHHRAKFAFCAHPAEYGVTGGATFILNDGNTIFCRQTYSDIILEWPSDEDMRHLWGKGD